jgi:hypothetical protein
MSESALLAGAVNASDLLLAALFRYSYNKLDLASESLTE